MKLLLCRQLVILLFLAIIRVGSSDKGKAIDRNLLIVNTIDGTIRAIDESDGTEVWKVVGSPHVSQSITNLEYRNEKGQSYRLVPSLEGALFLVEPTAMRPLSFTAGDLLASSFQNADNSLLVGAQESEVVVINTLTGNIVFNCTKEGCENKNGSMDDIAGDPALRLIVHRRRNTVRSVDVNTGHENWNFSVSQNELAAHLPHMEIAPTSGHRAWRNTMNQRGPGVFKGVEYTFNVQRGLIIAAIRNPFSNVLWQVELGVSLHKVWSLRGGELQPMHIINPGQPQSTAIHHPNANTRTGKSTLTNSDACTQSSTDIFSGRTGSRQNDQQHYIYFGHFKGQLYVQLDSRGAMHLPYPIPPVPEGAADPTAIQKPRPHPPTGFYPSGEKVTAMVERVDDGDSLSVEAYGLSGNPISWWFQSLTFGLFVCVVAHLFISRVCHPQDKEAKRPSYIHTATQRTDKSERPTDSGIPLSPDVSTSGTPSFSSSQSFASRYATEYTHIRCLGRGGFGVVSEARNNMDGCSYAVKRVSVKDNDDNYDRLSREVKALARFDHPGVVRYFMAWIERPPAGWQESRDKELKLYTYCKDAEELNLTSADSSSFHRTNNNIQTSSYIPYLPRKRYSDSVEIIFRKPQAFDESSDNPFEVGFQKRTLSRISSYSPDATESSSSDERESSTSMEPSTVSLPRRPVDDSVEIVFQSPDTKEQESGVKDDTTESHAKKTVDGKGNVPMLYLYIVMELCAAGSLKYWLEDTAKNRPPHSELYKMFAQMVDSVSHVHRSGLMHRDLKPSNIFFSRFDDKFVKIGDFGLVATNSSQSGSRESSLSSDDLANDTDKKKNLTDRVGTRLYMSPELEAGRDYDFKVDIFSLGLILLELLVPFGTQMERVQSLYQAKRGILPKEFEQSYPDDAALIRRLLCADPSKRPTCEQILEDPLVRSAHQQTVQHRYRTLSRGAMCCGDTQ